MDGGKEPKTSEAVTAWIERATSSRDRFRDVWDASVVHRQEHGCDVYPGREAPLFGVLAAATHAQRILEIGCGIGYSALWLSFGSAPDGRLQTVERDSTHARLAHENFERKAMSDRIEIIEGEWPTILSTLDPPYDLLTYDAAVPTTDDLERFVNLLRRGGVLITSNLFLGQYVPDLPALDSGAAYRDALLSDDRWLTSFASEKAVSVLQRPGRWVAA
jgi:predicted O-methyltransferase YrrM